MKKILLVFSLIFISLGAFAQNLQLHYDFGRAAYDKEFDGRPVLTSTVEHFKADKYGSTFFFIDMDYTSKGVASAYWEIARELKFWDAPFSAHIEYNGGVTNQFSINNAYLLGVTYTNNNSDFTRGFSFSTMYKYIQKHPSPNNFQLTGTWYIHFNKKMFTFSGFADLWREETAFGKLIFMSEPQFWLNLNQLKGVNKNFNLSVGTEVELTNNFGGHDGFYAIPTLALKWTFN